MLSFATRRQASARADSHTDSSNCVAEEHRNSLNDLSNNSYDVNRNPTGIQMNLASRLADTLWINGGAVVGRRVFETYAPPRSDGPPTSEQANRASGYRPYNWRALLLQRTLRREANARRPTGKKRLSSKPVIKQASEQIKKPTSQGSSSVTVGERHRSARWMNRQTDRRKNERLRAKEGWMDG